MRSCRRANEDLLVVVLAFADKEDDADNDADEDKGTEDTTDDCRWGGAGDEFPFLFWEKERDKHECL